MSSFRSLVGKGYTRRFNLAVQLSDGTGRLSEYRVMAVSDSWVEIKKVFAVMVDAAQDPESEIYAVRVYDQALDKVVRSWNYE